MNKPYLSVLLGVLMGLTLEATSAEASPYANRFEPAAATYTFEVDTALRNHSRDYFGRPVYLFANRVQKIRSESLVTTFSINVHWTDSIALHFSMPMIARRLVADFSPVTINENQILPVQTREYINVGPGDPVLSLSWMAHESNNFNLYTELGTSIPLDDNPGSSTVPTRIPTSTGQNSIFAGLGMNVSISSMRLHVHYRGEYLPGNAASYLVHQSANQTWLTGALSQSHKHHVYGTFNASPTDNLTVQVKPGWVVRQLPKRLVQGQLVEDTNVTYLEDLYLEGALIWQVAPNYAAKIWVRNNLTNSADLNPFFPMETPLPGVGLSFTARRW